MTKKHIAIEGIDGSGKTTLAKEIAEKLNYDFVEKPFHYLLGENGMEIYKNIVPQLNSSQSQLVKSLFYACGNAYTLNNFKKIVTDRHILSNFFHNSSKENLELFKFLNNVLRKPDLTILLYCKNKIRKDRMIERNPLDKDIVTVDNFQEQEFEKMKKFLRENNYNYVIIDNTNLTPEETLASALTFIKDVI